MSDATPNHDQEEPIEEVVRDTVDPDSDPITRREAVELELDDLGRSEEGADLDVSRVLDSPAAGVIDDDLAGPGRRRRQRPDPPEPSEPG